MKYKKNEMSDDELYKLLEECKEKYKNAVPEDYDAPFDENEKVCATCVNSECIAHFFADRGLYRCNARKKVFSSYDTCRKWRKKSST